MEMGHDYPAPRPFPHNLPEQQQCGSQSQESQDMGDSPTNQSQDSQEWQQDDGEWPTEKNDPHWKKVIRDSAIETVHELQLRLDQDRDSEREKEQVKMPPNTTDSFIAKNMFSQDKVLDLSSPDANCSDDEVITQIFIFIINSIKELPCGQGSPKERSDLSSCPSTPPSPPAILTPPSPLASPIFKSPESRRIPLLIRKGPDGKIQQRGSMDSSWTVWAGTVLYCTVLYCTVL